MSDPAAPAPRMWRYRRPFQIDAHDGLVLFDARLDGLASTLLIDGVEVARDHTPAAGPEAIRNHHLAATLADGREIAVEAGYISMINVAIAVSIDGAPAYASHPGRVIAFPARAARWVAQKNAEGQAAYDVDKLRRNKVPIAVDIATALLFFVVAKLTDLRTAALVGAAVGVALLVVQRFVRVDLIGGLALFGIFMLLVSAGFAMLFEDEEIIKQRSTIVGLVGAVCFLFDGLVLKGRRLGAGASRYIAFNDIDPARFAIGMSVTGIVMAAGNWLVARLFSTDVWLFYTTFVDIALSVGMFLLMLRWARSAPRRPAQA